MVQAWGALLCMCMYACDLTLQKPHTFTPACLTTSYVLISHIHASNASNAQPTCLTLSYAFLPLTLSSPYCLCPSPDFLLLKPFYSLLLTPSHTSPARPLCYVMRRHVPKHQASHLLPQVFEEYSLRLYSRNRDPKVGRVAAADGAVCVRVFTCCQFMQWTLMRGTFNLVRTQGLDSKKLCNVELDAVSCLCCRIQAATCVL